MWVCTCGRLGRLRAQCEPIGHIWTHWVPLSVLPSLHMLWPRGLISVEDASVAFLLSQLRCLLKRSSKTFPLSQLPRCACP